MKEQEGSEGSPLLETADSTNTPLRKKETSFTEIEGDLVLYNPISDAYLVLNATAAFIWKLLDGSNSLDEIARAMSENFRVEREEAKQDLLELLKVLEEKELLDNE